MNFEVGQIFENTYPPEAASWCNSNNAYIEEIERQGNTRRFRVTAIPDPTLEEAKEDKLTELTNAFDTAASTAHLTSSVGFEIDANEVANRNIEGLTLVMGDDDTTMFCDYNNGFHEVTKAQLETMRKEIVANSQRLYQIKWQYRSLIEAATTVEEIEAIVVDIVVPES